MKRKVGVGMMVVGLGAMMAGCVTGGQYHRLGGSDAPEEGVSYDLEGSVQTVDLGLVADFRVVRVASLFEGHRRQIEGRSEGSGGVTVEETVELNSVRLDVPLVSLMELGSSNEGGWYPGRMAQRHGLEVWASGSWGTGPIQPASATLGVAYYRYGGVSARLFGGWSSHPYRGVGGAGAAADMEVRRLEGRAPGAMVGVEVTVAAGEYALEIARAILDIDRESRATW